MDSLRLVIFLIQRISVTEDDLCPAVFDGYLCWPKTPAGSTVEKPCPKGVAGLEENSELKSTFIHSFCCAVWGRIVLYWDGNWESMMPSLQTSWRGSVWQTAIGLAALPRHRMPPRLPTASPRRPPRLRPLTRDGLTTRLAIQKRRWSCSRTSTTRQAVPKERLPWTAKSR